MNNKNEDLYFWAKTTEDGIPGISVYEHMINVGCVARYICELFPELVKRFQLTSSLVGAIAALHDLGKISPGFQRKCEAWLAENDLSSINRNCCWDTSMEPDHGKVSHAAIQAFLNGLGVDRNTAKYISSVIGAHHGRLNPPNDRGYRPQKGVSESHSHIDWDAERMKNAHMVWDYFIKSNLTFEITDESPALWWIAGLTSVADWIGSDERFFSPEHNGISIDKVSAATNALDYIGFQNIKLVQGLSFHHLFHDANHPEIQWQPNEMQEKVHSTVISPGVYVIEAPMGMGKTEAALWAAYQLLVYGRATGIYFALPTQATSNRMHLRMKEYLRRISVESSTSRLIHSNSWLFDKKIGLYPAATCSESGREDARNGRDWFSSSKRALIAPFGVGTIDQALLGVVAAKHFFVRHFALAGKVVILDEVHSYDIYTGTLIDKLVTTLEGLGCTVIILSATLSGKRRGQIVDCLECDSNDEDLSYPVITGRVEGDPFDPVVTASSGQRTVNVDFISNDKASQNAIDLARKGGAVIWICNTVDEAQKQYQRFIEINQKDFPVGLLHSRFPFWRREELENIWMEKFGKDGTTRCGSILVSTQIVEQSVDLDADLMITELAPTDMLLQRLGRLWRHERKYRPTEDARLYIITESKSLDEFRILKPQEIKNELGSKGYIYEPFVLLRTLQVWQGLKKISIPKQIRALIRATYEDRDNEPESWLKLSEDTIGKAFAYRQKAAMSSNIWNIPLPDEEGIQTRLNELPTIDLILCRNISEHEAVFADRSQACLEGNEYRFATAQSIHKNLVRVPEYCFDHIKSLPALTDYLHGKYCIGIVSDSGTVEVHGLKNGIHLFYSDDLGVVIE